jgi:hypothetical protein
VRLLVRVSDAQGLAVDPRYRQLGAIDEGHSRGEVLDRLQSCFRDCFARDEVMRSPSIYKGTDSAIRQRSCCRVAGGILRANYGGGGPDVVPSFLRLRWSWVLAQQGGR